jgi:Cytochrome c552
MTTVPSTATVRADFSGIVDSVVAGPMRLERHGESFSAEFADPDERDARINRQVALVTGSHQQQVYWYATGSARIIGQLPAMYLIREARWIPRSAAFLRPPAAQPSETGRWNGVCIDCHATHGQWRLKPTSAGVSLSAREADTHVAEFGIACEACHGPADAHVRVNSNPLRRYLRHWRGTGDDTVVEPSRLRSTVSSDVCGQCHGVWNFYEKQDEDAANRDGLPYRPGDALGRTRFIVRPAADRTSPTMTRLMQADPGLIDGSFWPDGMIRVSGREYNGLIESPCYRNASDDAHRMTCFSCHDMHKGDDDPRPAAEWADTHQLARDRGGDEACLQCHQSLGSGASAHTHHGVQSNGSRCQNCHMPYTTYGLLRALRSHQVSSPSVKTTLDTGRPNACNLCHLDKTLAWADERLAAWYGVARTSLDPDQQSIAASILWVTKGDAGQRALAAWSMGWRPAQEAAGTGWMPPFLAGLLDDPYDAVRFIAGKTLQSLPDYERTAYDFMAPSASRVPVGGRVLEAWLRRSAKDARPAVLVGPDGTIDGVTLARLLAARDNRRIKLRE